MRWWPRKPIPPDPPTPFTEEGPALEKSTLTTKCVRPDCFNDIPPDRQRFCSNECLKAYSVSLMGKMRGLRTLRGYTYQGSRARRRAERRRGNGSVQVREVRQDLGEAGDGL